MFNTSYPPIITLQGKNQRIELYSDRIIARPSGWLARRLPVIFSGAQMLYLDEITNASIIPMRFTPELQLRLIINGRHRTELIVDYFEPEYTIANKLIDAIELYIEQGEFQPPANRIT